MTMAVQLAVFCKRFLVLSSLLSLAASCRPAAINGSGDGGSASIIASVPTVTGLTASTLAYRLICDANAANLAPTGKPATDLNGTPTPAGATQTVAFTGASKAKAGDTCALQVKYATGLDITKDSNYSHWQWTSLQKTVGLFYASSSAQLQTATGGFSLSLVLYPTYVDTSTFVSAKVTVTLPAGVSTTGALATGGTFNCDNQLGGTSTSAAVNGQTIQYSYTLAPNILNANSKCDVHVALVAGGPTYSEKAAFTVVANQLTYTVATALTLDTTPPPTSSGQIAVTTNQGTCAAGQVFDPTQNACVASGATSTPTPSASVPTTPTPTPAPAPTGGTFTANGRLYLGTCDVAAAAGTGYWQESLTLNADSSYTNNWNNYSDAACSVAGTQTNYAEKGTFSFNTSLQAAGGPILINFVSPTVTPNSFYEIMVIVDANTIKLDNHKYTDLSQITATTAMTSPETLAGH